MGKPRWIKIYSGIKNSAVWNDPLRLKAWIDILLSANYQDREWFHNGQVLKIKRGQFVTSIRKLAESWKCSTNTVRRILIQFEELHMIERKSDTLRYTLLTVVKYVDFQDGKVHDGYSDGYTDEHSDGYSDGHSDEYSDGTQHKNIKKEKKEEEPEPHLGGPDGFGDPPAGWDDECEERYQYDHQWNPKQSRRDWWEFWKE